LSQVASPLLYAERMPFKLSEVMRSKEKLLVGEIIAGS
jgi:hypothetical protein